MLHFLYTVAVTSAYFLQFCFYPTAEGKSKAILSKTYYGAVDLKIVVMPITLQLNVTDWPRYVRFSKILLPG